MVQWSAPGGVPTTLTGAVLTASTPGFAGALPPAALLGHDHLVAHEVRLAGAGDDRTVALGVQGRSGPQGLDQGGRQRGGASKLALRLQRLRHRAFGQAGGGRHRRNEAQKPAPAHGHGRKRVTAHLGRHRPR